MAASTQSLEFAQRKVSSPLQFGSGRREEEEEELGGKPRTTGEEKAEPGGAWRQYTCICIYIFFLTFSLSFIPLSYIFYFIIRLSHFYLTIPSTYSVIIFVSLLYPSSQSHYHHYHYYHSHYYCITKYYYKYYHCCYYFYTPTTTTTTTTKVPPKQLQE